MGFINKNNWGSSTLYNLVSFWAHLVVSHLIALLGVPKMGGTPSHLWWLGDSPWPKKPPYVRVNMTCLFPSLVVKKSGICRVHDEFTVRSPIPMFAASNPHVAATVVNVRPKKDVSWSRKTKIHWFCWLQPITIIIFGLTICNLTGQIQVLKKSLLAIQLLMLQSQVFHGFRFKSAPPRDASAHVPPRSRCLGRSSRTGGVCPLCPQKLLKWIPLGCGDIGIYRDIFSSIISQYRDIWYRDISWDYQWEYLWWGNHRHTENSTAGFKEKTVETRVEGAKFVGASDFSLRSSLKIHRKTWKRVYAWKRTPDCSEILDNDICCDPTYYGFIIVHMVTWQSPILRNNTFNFIESPAKITSKNPTKWPSNDRLRASNHRTNWGSVNCPICAFFRWPKKCRKKMATGGSWWSFHWSKSYQIFADFIIFHQFFGNENISSQIHCR